MEDEYELIPMNPIRRLEKRMERMERTGSANETTKELIEIVRANQHVIDDVVRMNAEMISRMSELLGSVNSMTAKINDFMGRLEVASEHGEADDSGAKKELDDRMIKLEKRLNALVLSTLARKKMAVKA